MRIAFPLLELGNTEHDALLRSRQAHRVHARGQLGAVGCRNGDRQGNLEQPIHSGRQIASERCRRLHALLGIDVQIRSSLQITCERAERSVLACGQHTACERVRDWDDVLVDCHARRIKPKTRIAQPGQWQHGRKAAQLQRGQIAFANLNQVVRPAIDAVGSKQFRQRGRAELNTGAGRSRGAGDDWLLQRISECHKVSLSF